MCENNQFCRGSVCMFHGDCFSHDVELDSGEYVTGIRLWNESVQVIDPETTSRPARHFTSVGKSFHHGKYVAKPAGFLKRNKEEACAKMQSAKRRAIHFQHEANALSIVQRCESCSRSHKSIAYCISRGSLIILIWISRTAACRAVRVLWARQSTRNSRESNILVVNSAMADRRTYHSWKIQSQINRFVRSFSPIFHWASCDAKKQGSWLEKHCRTVSTTYGSWYIC